MKKLLLTFLFCMIGFAGTINANILHLECESDDNFGDYSVHFRLDIKNKTAESAIDVSKDFRKGELKVSEEKFSIFYHDSNVLPSHDEINRYTGKLISYLGEATLSYNCVQKSKKF